MRVLSTLAGGLSLLFAKQPVETADGPPSYEVVAPKAPKRTLVGDWEPPQALLLVYSDGWPEALLPMLETVSARMPVVMLVEDGVSPEEAAAAVDGWDLPHRERILPTGLVVDSVWARDYAPLQTWDEKGRLVWLDAPYDDERPSDDGIPEYLAKRTRRTLEPILYSIDGGSVASSGDQLCVSTIEYFDRNEIDWRDEMETLPIMRQLGCATMVLVRALVDEETKHVDAFLQFVSPGVVVISSYDPRRFPEDAARTDAAAVAVASAAEKMGKSLEIVRVPAPSPEGRDYPSYVNFLQLGDVALVPSYGTAPRQLQEAAMRALAFAMPDVALVPIPSDAPVSYGGAVHCLTWGMLRSTP